MRRLRALGGLGARLLLQFRRRFSRFAALFDDPEVWILLDNFLEVGGAVPRRHSEALCSRADLLPLPSGQLNAGAAIHPPALTSKTGDCKAAQQPLGLTLVEVPEPGLVVGDALLV